MSDVAQILTGGMSSSSSMYLHPTSSTSSNIRKHDPTVAPPKAPPPAPASHHPSRALKMTSMSREVMDLISGNQDKRSAALPPITPAFPILAAPKRDGLHKQQDATHTSVKIGTKWISNKPARKWAWAPFVSSSRTDGAMFRHWVRANVEYSEYPYARFDIHLEPVTYSDEEYTRHLQHDTWTRSETDQLLEVARKFELRWPVIYDRWIEAYYDQRHIAAGPQRKLEDLQHRYYSVAAILAQSRIAQEAAAEVQALTSAATAATSATGTRAVPLNAPLAPATDLPTAPAPVSAVASPKAPSDTLLMETAAARSLALSDPQHQPLIANIGTGTTNKVFNLQHERERRARVEQIWHRTKEDEMEEEELRKELRLIETQIRKVKKAGGHILAATANGAVNAATSGSVGGAAAPSILSSAASSRNPSRSVTPIPPSSSINLSSLAAASTSENSAFLLDQCFASTAPIPTPQTPYLQSGRLVPPAAGGPMGLTKALLSRMDTVLAELKVPARPIPTKRVCDMYDAVRKDILTLLTLQKMTLQREGQLQSKRLKLSKMGGTVGRVTDEETLLGVPPTLSVGANIPNSNRAKTGPTTVKSTKPRTNVGGGSVSSKGKTVAAVKPGSAPATVASSTAIKQEILPAVSEIAVAMSAAAPAGPVGGGAPPAVVASTAPAAVGKVEHNESTGGKQAKKTVAKRKKKPESKSPNPTATATVPGAAAPVAVAGTATTVPPPIAVAVPPPAPGAVVVATKALTENEAAKSSGKKRPRKS